MNGLQRLQKFLHERELDGILLISPTNLHYFAGFTGTTAVAFVTPKSAIIITDSRYTEQAQEQCEGYEVIEYRLTVWNAIKEFLKKTDYLLKTCAFEGNQVPYDTVDTFAKVLSDTDFVSVTLEELRAVKREDELAIMRQVAKIADDAFAVTLPQLKVGMTENEARIILEMEMLKRGSTEPSFATIVASGYRSSMPHGVATDKIIESGDFVTFDFGAVYKGYHSDMTRTVVMGKASDLQLKLYHIVLQAQLKGLEMVKAGISGKTVDAACREYIKNAGYGAYFNHGTGHGVGLDIHEQPVASPRSESILEENMILTVEPGIYLPGKIGLRIEDSVIVTRNGCEIITNTSKKLIEISN